MAKVIIQLRARARRETEQPSLIPSGAEISQFPAAYGGVSVVLFVMYWIDKRAAQRGSQRTAEKTLHLFELCCGWPGALMAQQVFRHKTRKGSYQFVFWLAVLANLGALGWLMVAPEAMSFRQQLGF